MKNSFFSRFTPKEPKFFPLLKQLSEILSSASDLLAESLKHDSPAERAELVRLVRAYADAIDAELTGLREGRADA